MSMSINTERTRMDINGLLMDCFCWNGCRRDKPVEELLVCFICGSVLCEDCWNWHRQLEFMRTRAPIKIAATNRRFELWTLFRKA